MFKKIKILVDYYWNRVTNKKNMIKYQFATKNPFSYNEIIYQGDSYMRYLKKGWFVLIPNSKLQSCLKKSGETL